MVAELSDKGIDAPSARIPLASALGLYHGKLIEEVKMLLAFHEEGEVVPDAGILGSAEKDACAPICNCPFIVLWAETA